MALSPAVRHVLPHVSRRRRRHHVAALVAAGLLAWQAQARAQGLFGALAPKPERIELVEGADLAQVFLKAASPGGLAPSAKVADVPQRRIAVGSLQVEFVTQQAGRAGARGSTDVEKVYTLQGIDEASLQPLADQALAALQRQLAARGYELLARDALAASGYKVELDGADGTMPARFDEGETLSGRLRAAGLGGGARGGPADNTARSLVLTAQGTAPRVFDGLAGSFRPCMAAAEELGAVVLQLRLKLGFMQIDDTGSWGFSEVEGKPQDLLAAQGTRVDVCAPGGRLWRYQLHKPVALPGRMGGEVREVAPTATEKAAGTAQLLGSAVLGFLGGSGRGGIAGAAGSAAGALHSQAGSGRFDVIADPGHVQAALRDLQLSTALLIEALPR